MKYRGFKTLLAIFLLGAAAATVRADAKESAEAFASGIKAFEAKDYMTAAEYFAKAELLTDDEARKFDAAKREAESYKKAGHKGKEFDSLQKIVKNYPSKINFSEVIDRQFAIGDAYYHGYKDPAFWSLRFIPFLTGKNRMQEIYEAAIKHAPYAPSGAMARLRLAVHYLKSSDNEKALEMLREIIRCFPDTEAARFAMLELGNALSEMSLTGDGDEKYYNEAISVLQEFRKKYPDLSENEWVTQCENNVRSACAQRLYQVAEFYHKEGQDNSATVYLLDVMRRFPDTQAADASERLLTKLDKTYFPEQIRPEIPPNYPKYEMLKFPQENRTLLVAPSASNGKFLLPVYDLNLNKEKK